MTTELRKWRVYVMQQVVEETAIDVEAVDAESAQKAAMEVVESGDGFTWNFYEAPEPCWFPCPPEELKDEAA